MSRTHLMTMALAGAAIASGFGLQADSRAQATGALQVAGFQSKAVLVSPITGVEGRELVLITATIEPGGASPAHSHPGDCYGTVIDGTIELRAEGKAPRRVAVGDSYSNLAGPVHQFVNVGDRPARLLNTLVVEKGKPRTVMQPDSLK